MGSTPDFPHLVVASDCTVPVATIFGVFIPYFCENQTIGKCASANGYGLKKYNTVIALIFHSQNNTDM